MPFPSRLIPKLFLLFAIVLLSAAATGGMINHGRATLLFERWGRAAEAQALWPFSSPFAKALGDRLFKASIPPDAPAAAAHYRRALELNPHESVHWQDWAEVNWRLGRRDAATRAFDMAIALAPNNHRLQQEIGNFLLEQGRIEDAAQRHARAIALRPEVARGIYPVYWGLGWSPIRTAKVLLGANPVILRRYWIDCLAWMEPPQAAELWEALTQDHKHAFDDVSRVAYFDFLVSRRLYPEAQRMWSEIVKTYHRVDLADNPRDALFWNGDFSRKRSLGAGLEWLIARSMPPGVQAVIATGRDEERGPCLWIHFEGRDNIAFHHVRHGFFIEPGARYRLHYQVRALNVTTDCGPYVQITIPGEPPLRASGAVITGTLNRTYELDFAAPPAARWAELSIRRDPSRKLDNRIKGDVWFDDFWLEALDGDAAAPTAGAPEREREDRL